MQNIFFFITTDDDERSVFLVAERLLFSCLYTKQDRNETKYVFPRYIKCTLVLAKVDNELNDVCPRGNIIYKAVQSAFRGVYLNGKTEMNVGAWSAVE